MCFQKCRGWHWSLIVNHSRFITLLKLVSTLDCKSSITKNDCHCLNNLCFLHSAHPQELQTKLPATSIDYRKPRLLSLPCFSPWKRFLCTSLEGWNPYWSFPRQCYSLFFLFGLVFTIQVWSCWPKLPSSPFIWLKLKNYCLKYCK